MFFLHNQCRACGFGQQKTPAGIKIGQTNDKLIEVFNLGIQPLSNDFRNDEEEHAGYAPLKVMFCPNCTLAQLSVTVRPDIMYSQYSYVTSQSQMMRDHFAALDKEITLLGGKGKVLEIGSNDGTLLEYLKAHGHESVFGIDPADNLALKANQKGIPTLCEMFDTGTAKAWRKECGIAGVILARHVFCHVDDWQDFVTGLEEVSDKHTLIGIEVPWASKTLSGVEYDTIYFEHLSYLTIRSMQALVESTTLHIHAVSHYPVHGGSIVIWLRHDDSGYEPMDFGETLNNERASLEDWRQFAAKANESIAALKEAVARFRHQGKRVVGFGASAKATVSINACGFTRKDIEYVTDTTPEKMYKLIPGTDIPVLDQGALLRDMPDVAVMYCWNFCDEVLANQKLYLEKGGRFILPVPSVRIVP